MPAFLDPSSQRAPRASPPSAPNALIVGAMKASTTLLFETLGMHPSVFTPAVKEPHFFSGPNPEAPEAWEEYLALFRARRPEQTIALEASTTYSRWPQNADTAPLIQKRLGSPRLIYILRDPLERAVSHYRHSYARGYYTPGTTFDRAITIDPILLNASRYAMQLARYDDVFGPDATLVVLAENFHRDRAETLARVADHLGIAQHTGWNRAPDRANSAESVRSSAPWRPLLDRFPLLRSAAQRVPPGWRARVKALRRPAPEAPRPTETMLEHARRALAEDALALERRIGPLVRRWRSTPIVAARRHGQPSWAGVHRDQRDIERVGA